MFVTLHLWCHLALLLTFTKTECYVIGFKRHKTPEKNPLTWPPESHQFNICVPNSEYCPQKTKKCSPSTMVEIIFVQLLKELLNKFYAFFNALGIGFHSFLVHRKFFSLPWKWFHFPMYYFFHFLGNGFIFLVITSLFLVNRYYIGWRFQKWPQICSRTAGSARIGRKSFFEIIKKVQ